MISNDQLLNLARYGTDDDRRLVHLYLTDPYYSFRPRPDCPEEFDEQESFVNSQHRGIICAVAGNASGKTYAAAWKVANFLRSTEAPSDLCKFFVVSQTLKMVGLIWQEKLSKFIPPEMVDDVSYFNSKENHPNTVILKPGKNGNRWMICFRSYEMGRKALQAASQVAGFWCDEQIGSMNLLSELDTRCREYDYPGSKLYTLTPLEPDEELEERFDDPEKWPYWKFFRLNAEKNYEAGGLATLDWLLNTPEDMRETRRIGDFCLLSGAVFKEFDQNVHVISPRRLNPNAPRFRSVDFGYSVDTHVIEATEDGDTIYVTKEWYGSGMRIEDKVKKTLEEMPGLLTTYADGEDAQQRREWAERGIPTVIGRKDPVRYGVELLRTRMSQKRLFIFSNCKKLISQIKNYRWKEASENAEEDVRQERPVKRNDHGVDALRMLVHSREKTSLAAWESAKNPIGPVSRV